MDYMTKPLSRTGVRNISKLVRRIFNLTPDEPFPVLRILDKLCVTFPRTEYQIVEDDKLPKTVFAWCFPKPEDGFKIEIKQTVYDEACFNNNRPFLCFICHEICHVILFNLGFTPISPRTLGKETSIPAYRSVE